MEKNGPPHVKIVQTFAGPHQPDASCWQGLLWKSVFDRLRTLPCGFVYTAEAVTIVGENRLDGKRF
jgi:hypothetical protein